MVANAVRFFDEVLGLLESIYVVHVLQTKTLYVVRCMPRMIRCGQSATNMYDDNHHPLTIYTTCMMKVFRTALEAVTRRLSGQPRSRNKDYDYDDTTTTPNMTKDEVNALGFHKLRSACARHGLPATGKACELRKRLLDLIPSAVVAVSEPIIDTIATVSMTLDDVNSLTYNQLRSACARHGLPRPEKISSRGRACVTLSAQKKRRFL